MADKLRRLSNEAFLVASEAFMEHSSPHLYQLIAGEFIHRDGSWTTEEQRRAVVSASPQTGISLRDISAELAARGHFNERGGAVLCSAD